MSNFQIEHVHILKKGFKSEVDKDNPLYGLLHEKTVVAVAVEKRLINDCWLDSDKSGQVWEYSTTISINGRDILPHEDSYKVMLLRLKSRCPELFDF